LKVKLINMNHPFENEIFNAFRINEIKIKKAIELLQRNDYKVYKKIKK